MNKQIMGVVILLAIPYSIGAQVFRCTQNGTTTYSEYPCAGDAVPVHIDPVPTDSLDNPETAARYRAQQEARAIQDAEQQRQQLEQERVADQIQHEKAVEDKLDNLQRELKRTRKQMVVNSALDRMQREMAASKAQFDSHTQRKLECRTNLLGTALNCN